MTLNYAANHYFLIVTLPKLAPEVGEFFCALHFQRTNIRGSDIVAANAAFETNPSRGRLKNSLSVPPVAASAVHGACGWDEKGRYNLPIIR